MTQITDSIDRALDLALEMTFPASDPIAVRSAGASTAARPVEPGPATRALVNGKADPAARGVRRYERRRTGAT
jgi:hypothetical protein